MARAAEAAGLAVKGVTKSGGASASAGIGGMVLVTSTGFRTPISARSTAISMQAIAGEGTGMERDYDYSAVIHAGDLDAPEKIGRSAGERAVKRLNPRKVDDAKGTGGVTTRASPVRWSGILPPRSTARPSRVARAFSRTSWANRFFRYGITIIDDPLRRRGLRSHPFDAEGIGGKRARADRGWPPDHLDSRLRDRARTWHDHDRARPARRFVDAVAGRRPTCISSPASRAPQQLIADIDDGFYVTDLIGMGANIVTGDYSRGAAGFWIEHGELTYAVSEVTIAGQLAEMFRRADARQRSRVPLWHQCADRCASRD